MSHANAQPAGTGRWRQRLLNILVPLTLTIVGVTLVLEFGLRHFYQLIPIELCASDPVLAHYYCQPYLVYDKPIELGYRYQPDLHLAGWWNPADPYITDAGPETRPTGRDDTFWFELNTDEMGFPNNNPTWQDSYDVVIAGDSFVVPTAPKSWITLFEEQTSLSALTLGASSWSTLNEVEAVRQFGLAKDPDWVILLYFEGNDLLNTAQFMDKQASGLSWREYDFQDVAWYRRFLTYHLLRYPWLEDPETGGTPVYRYPVTAVTEAGPIEAVFMDVHLLPMSADYETLERSDEFAAVSAALLDLQALTESQGSRLLLVYVPSKAHIYWARIWNDVDINNILARTATVTLSDGDHGRLVWDGRYLDYDTFNQNHNAQEQLLVNFATMHNIDMLNLTPVLWQATIANGEYYHYADIHWNQAGNQLVADTIAAYLATAAAQR